MDWCEAEAPLPQKPLARAGAQAQQAYREARKQANLNQVAAERMAQLRTVAAERPIHFVSDGRFTNKTLLRQLPANTILIGQQRLNSRQREDARIAAQIATAHEASRGTYGAPRILEDLREAGTHTSKRRCARLMREQGLHGRKKHRRNPRTTDSRHAQPVAANLMAERPAPTQPIRLG